MTRLFGRRAELHVGTRRINGLRIAFKVGKTDQREPNVAEIRVYNLGPESRAEIQKKGIGLILLAGYEARVEQLFAGDVQLASHVRMGPDWVTHLRAGDGENAFQKATFSASFKPGTNVKDVVLEVAKSMGLDLGQLGPKLQQHDFRGAWETLSQGWAGQGRSAPEFDRLMQSVGLEWSIQDGAIQALAPGETTDDDAVLLSPRTGLLGSPEHASPSEEGGPVLLRVKSLLQPSIRPGRELQVESANVKGRFVATRVLHTGDTHGQEWQTEAEARPL